ncbi:hypothetical protein [Gymnodinialimonas sp. 57CJ19]|uniref:hypothetical protein n=1 Tax=Gymnodinialimonas sp. 57CJ19 TaxID=3138498 RepID=UPI00313453B7
MPRSRHPIRWCRHVGQTNIGLTDIGALFGGIEPTVDRFALGLTIPIGNNGSTMPLNSNTRTARGDYRSALSAVINSF